MKPWPYPRLIAHRGGGTLAPENTLAGLRTARRYGYRAVEFDVMLSGDGIPVLIHDETLERTSNGRGKVAQTPWSRLRELDAGAWHGPAFAGEPLPSFEQAAKLCRELGLLPNIEIKPAEGFDVATGDAVARLARHWWRDASVQPLLSSFSVAALEAARAAAPELPRGLLVGALPPDWPDKLESLDCLSLHANASRIAAADIAAVRSRGYRFACYTVNDPAAVGLLFAAGADSVITDRPDLIPPGG